MHVLARCVCAGVALTMAGSAVAGPGVLPVWIPVPIDTMECPELDGYRSADLYLSFDTDPGRPAVTSDTGTGLAITGGTFYQDATGANGPRPEGWFKVFPCARWDTYLTVGDTTPFFSPEYPPLDKADWGTSIEAEWLANPGDPVVVEVDPVKFGNSRLHIRIARITGTPGTTGVQGQLDVVYFPIPGMPTVPVMETIQVPNCDGCWAVTADLNGDGVVNGADLAIMLAAWGPCGMSCPADLNGDNVVNGSDLAILLAAWG